MEVWADIKDFPDSCGSKRRIRDLSVLRFFPHFEEISIHCAEIADLSPLAGLQGLRRLKLSERSSPVGYALLDLSPIAGLPNLAEVDLNLDSPWPDLSPLVMKAASRPASGFPLIGLLESGGM